MIYIGINIPNRKEKTLIDYGRSFLVFDITEQKEELFKESSWSTKLGQTKTYVPRLWSVTKSVPSPTIKISMDSNLYYFVKSEGLNVKYLNLGSVKYSHTE